MKKEEIRELNDNELSSVSGGIRSKVTGIDSGDVFVQKDSPNDGIVVPDPVEIVDGFTNVHSIPFTIYENGDIHLWNPADYPWYFVEEIYEYSVELTGKIHW